MCRHYDALRCVGQPIRSGTGLQALDLRVPTLYHLPLALARFGHARGQGALASRRSAQVLSAS